MSSALMIWAAGAVKGSSVIVPAIPPEHYDAVNKLTDVVLMSKHLDFLCTCVRQVCRIYRKADLHGKTSVRE